MGASAGGLEAFRELLEQVPTDSPLAFLFVQHLDPTHRSSLPELLAHYCKLPVHSITNGMKVASGHIYVVPPTANVILSGGVLRLLPRRSGTLNLPIDILFRSLAEGEKNRAIGVLLSGSGADGTLGLQAIKGEGGITFAQDERSAKFPAMPSSAIATGCVDFVLSPQAIANELITISRHPYLKTIAKVDPGQEPPLLSPESEVIFADGEDHLQAIFSILRSRTGVDFSLYKHTTLRRRILRRMLLGKIDKLEGYVKRLQSDPGEVDAIFNDLLINVTSFFRDPEVFQAVRRKVLPRLMKNRSQDMPLRVWVVGCSTGEEAYSLAMTIVEFFDACHAHASVQIFATDISEAALEKARAGVYPENIATDVSPERLRRFFVKTEGGYQVSKIIRDMCIFARQNVITDPPFSNVDLISCRNVLIYLGPLLQRKIMPVFHYALKQNGFLLLGASETIGNASDMYDLLDKKHKIYTKRHSLHRVVIAPLAPREEPAHLKAAHHPFAEPALEEAKTPDLNQYVDRLILSRFSPAAVVTNLQMDVLYFRGHTSSFLEHTAGAASLNILKMARETLAMDLRTAVSKAVKQDAPIKHHGAVIRRHNVAELIDFEVIPFRITPGSERFLLVIFDYHRTSAIPADAMVPAAGGKLQAQAERRELTKLRQELAATRESLQAIIEEQEATNEELKSANEEIQSSNEELQSTNEELETAKEELQSTNEELTTLNEELQTRNNELSLVNNDLLNLLANVNMAVVMLGTDLTIRRFTPMAERIFNLIPSDLGRRLSDLNRNIVVPDLDEQLKKVVDHLTTIEQDVQDRNGRWFSMRIRPYRTRENRIEGAVLMLLDIHPYKLSLEQVIQSVREPLAALYGDFRIRMANTAFSQLVGARSKDDLVDKSVFEICDGNLDSAELRHALDTLIKQKRVPEHPAVEIRTPAGPRKFITQLSSVKEDGRLTDFILLSLEPAPNLPRRKVSGAT